MALPGLWLPPGLIAPRAVRPPELISFSTATKDDGLSAGMVINKPSGAQAGDVVILTAFLVDTAEASHSITTPSGFTSLADLSGAVAYRVMVRTLDGSEGSTFTVERSPPRWSWGALLCELYRHAGTPELAVADNTQDPPNLTPSFGAVPAMWLAKVMVFNAASQSAPTGYPSGYTAQNTASYNPGGANRLYVATAKKEATLASDNPGAFTGTANLRYAFTIAIPPG